ncbi:MAG: hypothetical protein K2M07_06905 [Muribaculaceae bacterium]|nr:hypothetical protein [Muribaculaceae bacterium]
MKKENICQLIRESEQLLHEDNLPDAVRVSGEALVNADSVWSRMFNAGEQGGDAILTVLDAGVIHSLTLFMAQEWKESLETAVMLDFQAALDGIDGRLISTQLLKLRNLALTSFINLLERMPGSDDPELRSHVSIIMEYLLALTYQAATAVSTSEPSAIDPSTRAALARSKETMEFLLSNGMTIHHPDIDVCGSRVNTDSPLEILRDLLGRLRAIM